MSTTPTYIFSPGGVTLYDNVDYAAACNVTCNAAGGNNYTTAMWFRLSSNATITGVKWWQSSNCDTAVKVSLWDTSGSFTRLATITVTADSGAINTATFSSPYDYTVNAHNLAVSVYNGVDQMLYHTGFSGDPMPFGYAGNYINIMGSGYAGGDTIATNPTFEFSSQYFGIMPVYTVP